MKLNRCILAVAILCNLAQSIIVDKEIKSFKSVYPKCLGSPLTDTEQDSWRCDHFSGATGKEAEKNCEAHFETAKQSKITVQCKVSRQGPGFFNCLASEPCSL